MNKSTPAADNALLNQERSESEASISNVPEEQRNTPQSDTTDNIAANDVKKRLFSDETFQRLKDIQEAVFRETDVSPGLRKLLDLLITDQRLQEIKQQLIKQFST